MDQYLLFTCFCFFLQSLLGLSDVKLKSELAGLVDIQLWVAAQQDVKQREKTAKTRLAEILVENRMREDEMRRRSEALSDATKAVNELLRDLQAAQDKVADEMGVSRTVRMQQQAAAAGDEVGPESLSELNDKLRTLVDNARAYADTHYTPLRAEYTAVTKKNSAALVEATSRVSQMKEKLAHNRALLTTLNAAVSTTTTKLKQSEDLIAGVKRDYEAVCAKLAVHGVKVVMNVADVESALMTAREELQTFLVSSGQLESGMATVRTSIQRLKELSKDSSSSSSASRVSCEHNHGQRSDESCPTCGQALPLEARQGRAEELLAELSAMEARKAALSRESSGKKNQVDLLQSMLAILQRLRSGTERDAELRAELLEARDKQAAELKRKEELEAECTVAVMDREKKEGMIAEAEKKMSADFLHAETTIKKFNSDEITLRRRIDKVSLVCMLNMHVCMEI